jgi:HNH endonuclease
MAVDTELRQLIRDVLCGGSHFLSGLHRSTPSLPDLVAAVVQWGSATGRSLSDIVRAVEPCVRQTVLMNLIPARAVDRQYHGSLDDALDEHLAVLGITLTLDERVVLRSLCINVRKYLGLSASRARAISMTVATLRGQSRLYSQVLSRQGGRCHWCGVNLELSSVLQTLDHVAPKHLGNDLPDGSNWALSCQSCNSGKSDTLAWAATAEAHDFMSRSAFAKTHTIGLAQRWSVLARLAECDSCGARTTAEELWVYRRVRTGLPIPGNCSATCVKCAGSRKRDLLNVDWADQETERAKVAPIVLD